MYSEKVMDHFQHPRNVGEIENASGVGTVGNAKCGDIMRIYLDIDDNGIIQDVKFKTFGCGAAVATSSMATELEFGLLNNAVVIYIQIHSHDVSALCVSYCADTTWILHLSYVSWMVKMVHYLFTVCHVLSSS